MLLEEFCQKFDVSRESKEKLEVYHALLLKWQKAINLVSNSTLDEAWGRHFADSAQLAQYISEGAKTVMDLGSGAGFPGLVLAIMRPELGVHLVESDERKAQFLRTVSRETAAACVVHNERIESMDVGEVVPDLITARALSDLSQLCGYCCPWAEKNSNLELLFLKGETVNSEIEKARQTYDFELQRYESQTSETGSILHLRNLRICA